MKMIADYEITAERQQGKPSFTLFMQNDGLCTIC